MAADPAFEERIAALEREVAALRAAGPVAGWAELAEVTRQSTTTVWRARRAAGDRSEPWWPSRADALAWWDSLVQPRATAPRKPRPPATGPVFDASERRRRRRNS